MADFKFEDLGVTIWALLGAVGGFVVKTFFFGKKKGEEGKELENKFVTIENQIKDNQEDIKVLIEHGDNKNEKLEKLEMQVLNINNILTNNQRIDNEVLTAIDRLNNTITTTNTTLAVLNTNYQNTSKEVELLRKTTAEHGNRISKIER